MDKFDFKNAKKREKTVTRAYGGSQCGNCVRQRLSNDFQIYFSLN